MYHAMISCFQRLYMQPITINDRSRSVKNCCMRCPHAYGPSTVLCAVSLLFECASDCVAQDAVRTAKKQLEDSEAFMNSEYNLTVLYPTQRPNETPPPLSPQHEAVESTLKPSHLSLYVLEGADMVVPALAHFYRPTITAEQLDTNLYDNLIQPVLCGMTRANLVQVLSLCYTVNVFQGSAGSCHCSCT